MDPSHRSQGIGGMSTNASAGAGSGPMESDSVRMTGETRGEMMNSMPKAGMMAKGIATGVAVSAITQTGRGIMSTFAKNPLVMFGLGLAAGYFVHKYRKEIISTVSGAAEQGKEFVLRQKESLSDMLAETQEAAEESGGSK